MDLGTLLGLIVAILIFLKAVGTDLANLYDGVSLLFVVAGGLAATLIANPLQNIIEIFSPLKRMLFFRNLPPAELIERIVDYAAKRNGTRTNANDDVPFLKLGFQLVENEIEAASVEHILQTDLSFWVKRHRA